MTRLTISLPDDLASALSRDARRRGMSVSRIIREAVEAALGRSAGGDREIPFAALGRSGHADTSERVDELLAEGWSKDNLIDRGR